MRVATIVIMMVGAITTMAVVIMVAIEMGEAVMTKSKEDLLVK